MAPYENLAFDTAYVVYVPKEKYKKLFSIYGLITKEIVKKFHEIINEYLKNGMECIPLYENWEWSFDMIPIGEGGAETPDENNPDMKFTYEDLKTKSVAVHSSILPDQLFEFINMNDEDEVKTQSNSSRRITVGEVRGLKKEGETYKIPIEINGPAEAPNPSPHANTVSFVLTTVGDVYFLESGQRVRTIEVKNQNVLIGGRNATPDPQKQRPIIRLDREDVMNPQFEINKNNQYLVNFRVNR